jgi:hypothetical protein
MSSPVACVCRQAKQLGYQSTHAENYLDLPSIEMTCTCPRFARIVIVKLLPATSRREVGVGTRPRMRWRGSHRSGDTGARFPRCDCRCVRGRCRLRCRSCVAVLQDRGRTVFDVGEWNSAVASRANATTRFSGSQGSAPRPSSVLVRVPTIVDSRPSSTREANERTLEPY